MRFVLSFSGGKDSVLSLHQMIEAGHEPAALLVMYRPEEGRSWTHGIDGELLNAVSDALGIPLLRCEASADCYEDAMEDALREAKERLNAEACVFGDIDVEAHRQWNEARCAAAGLQAVMPLWGWKREVAVRKLLELGYRCIIKCVRRDLPESLLGEPLSEDVLAELTRCGADLCGENGEYHTLVVDGPIFRHPVETVNRGIVRMEHIAAADLVPILAE